MLHQVIPLNIEIHKGFSNQISDQTRRFHLEQEFLCKTEQEKRKEEKRVSFFISGASFL